MATVLKLRRIEQNIPQWKLAQVLGITSTELSRYELGRRRCPADLRRKIADVLSTTPEQLFPEEEHS